MRGAAVEPAQASRQTFQTNLATARSICMYRPTVDWVKHIDFWWLSHYMGQAYFLPSDTTSKIQHLTKMQRPASAAGNVTTHSHTYTPCALPCPDSDLFCIPTSTGSPLGLFGLLWHTYHVADVFFHSFWSCELYKSFCAFHSFFDVFVKPRPSGRRVSCLWVFYSYDPVYSVFCVLVP